MNESTNGPTDEPTKKLREIQAVKDSESTDGWTDEPTKKLERDTRSERFGARSGNPKNKSWDPDQLLQTNFFLFSFLFALFLPQR